MADNVTLPGTGVVISTDDVGSGVEVQRVKVQYGPDGTATDVDTATGLPVKGGYLEVSGSAAANNTDLTSTDVAGYRWVQVQLTGTWSATVTFQASMDNTNWVSVMLSRIDTNANGTSTSTTNNIYAGVLSARYFRVRTTAYTSGTVAATVGFSVHPGWSPASAMKVSGQDNFGTGDGAAVGYAFGVLALNDVWNGSTYDRVRSITSSKNTTGLGIPSAGMLGFDGTNYQAVKVDSTGTTAVGGAATPPTDANAFTNAALLAGGPVYVHNGGTWDRVRSANSADATSGTGLIGVGGMVWDGSFWNRAKSLGALGVAGVTPTPGTTGGWTVYSNTALSSTVQSVKSSAGTLGGYMIFNSNTAVAYVQVWNVASGSVTVGTTAPTYVLSIPAGSAANLELTCGVNHSTAISVAATTTPTGSTAPTTALVTAMFYK